MKRFLITSSGELKELFSNLVRLDSLANEVKDKISVSFRISSEDDNSFKRAMDLALLDPRVQGCYMPGSAPEPESWQDVAELDWTTLEGRDKYPMRYPYVTSGMPTKISDEAALTWDSTLFQGKKVCIVQPFDFTKEQDWTKVLDLPKWITLVEELLRRRWTVVQIGNAKDNFKIHNKVINFSEKLTLEWTVAFLNRCHLFIGCESWCWKVPAYKGINTIMMGEFEKQMGVEWDKDVAIKIVDGKKLKAWETDHCERRFTENAFQWIHVSIFPTLQGLEYKQLLKSIDLLEQGK